MPALAVRATIAAPPTVSVSTGISRLGEPADRVVGELHVAGGGQPVQLEREQVDAAGCRPRTTGRDSATPLLEVMNRPNRPPRTAAVTPRNDADDAGQQGREQGDGGGDRQPGGEVGCRWSGRR